MSAITVAALHKRLGLLIAAGHARKPVVIDKLSFVHPCEDDGGVILNVAGLGVLPIVQLDDNGGIQVNKDGSESYRQCLVLVGDARVDVNGNILAETDE